MIKMIAQRLHYHPDDGKEYKVGETFNVANEREADRLERRRRAERAPEMAKPAHVDAPKKAKPEVVEDENPKPKRAYHRRDMTAEETTAVSPMSYPGPTGEDEPSQS